MKMIKTHKDRSQPSDDYIFVFGSNEAGIHGAGAAKAARDKYGAIIGRGFGFHGRSLAIPTKDYQIKTLPIERIEEYIEDAFLLWSFWDGIKKLFLTRIGCGLAGYSDKDIAPIFAKFFKNYYDYLDIPEEWLPYFIANEKFSQFERIKFARDAHNKTAGEGLKKSKSTKLIGSFAEDLPEKIDE